MDKFLLIDTISATLTAMQRRLPATVTATSPRMATTKTPHFHLEETAASNQGSDVDDQPDWRQGTEDNERRKWLYKKVRVPPMKLLHVEDLSFADGSLPTINRPTPTPPPAP